MKRSDYLLMAYLEDDRIYFLDIVPHKSTDVLAAIQKAPSCEDIDYVDIEMISCTDSGYMFIEKQTNLLFFVKKENKDFAEYYLLGTLMSTLIVIICFDVILFLGRFN